MNPIQYNTGMMIESKDQNALRREYYKNNKDKFLEYCQTYRNKIWINSENMLRITTMKK
jgi:hypothetical protein